MVFKGNKIFLRCNIALWINILALKCFSPDGAGILVAQRRDKGESGKQLQNKKCKKNLLFT